MQTLNATFLDALEHGKGAPYMTCALLYHVVDGWNVQAEYTVLEAVLTRERQELYVAENLLADGLVDSVVDSGWAVQVTRGVTVEGHTYGVVCNLYYISYISYDQHEGRTHIIADLLPTTSLVGIDGTMTARQVIDAAIAQFNNLIYIVYDVNRDIWYDWQFYDTDKQLNLVDGRSLATVLQQKYFAYFFPRDFMNVYIYGVASNEGNNVDGTYTPFSHARTMTYLTTDKPVNLTWNSETGYQEYIDAVTNQPVTIGFISDTDDPRALSTFQKWTRIFSGYLVQYIQRPDLRLAQGDLVTVSTDGFTATRCLEQIEVYKSRKSQAKKESPASWYQIVRQLPYHPQYLVTEIPIDWWIPPFGSGSLGGAQTDPTQQKVMSASFTGLLNVDASSIQQAFELLDKHNHDADYAPIANGVTNGNSHDHAGGDGAQIAYSGLSGLPTLGSIADNAEADFAVAAKGVTNGDSHDHAGGDGAQVDHGGLAGLSDDDHTQYIKHSLATATSDFLAASGSGTFVKKTLAETRTLLNVDKNVIQILLNTTTALTSGNDAARFRVPAKLNGLNLTAVAASRKSGTGELNIMIRNVTDAVDMLSTALTVDTAETDSLTAATAAVINGSYDDVATGDQIAIDVDGAGTDTLFAIVELSFG